MWMGILIIFLMIISLIFPLMSKHLTKIDSAYFINLSNQSIETIEQGIFENANVAILDLSYNKIKDLRNMTDLRFLKQLNLAHNMIESIDKIFLQDISDTVNLLNLSHNFIKEVNLTGLNVINTIDLTSNELETISINLKSIKSLKISKQRKPEVKQDKETMLLKIIIVINLVTLSFMIKYAIVKLIVSRNKFKKINIKSEEKN